MANAYLGYARDINNRSTFHVRESIPNSQASTPEETGQSIHRSFRRTFWRLVRLRRPLLLRIPVPVQSSINITALRLPYDEWLEDLTQAGLDPHTQQHIATMARLHRDGRYNRLTHDVEDLTGRPAQSVQEYIRQRRELFT